MLAGTETPSPPLGLETLLPLLPRTLDTPAVSERNNEYRNTKGEL